MENPDHVRDATKRLPRGHAYIEIRNGGATIRIDMPEHTVEWLDELTRMAVHEALDQVNSCDCEYCRPHSGTVEADITGVVDETHE